MKDSFLMFTVIRFYLSQIFTIRHVPIEWTKHSLVDVTLERGLHGAVVSQEL